MGEGNDRGRRRVHLKLVAVEDVRAIVLAPKTLVARPFDRVLPRPSRGVWRHCRAGERDLTVEAIPEGSGIPWPCTKT
jgi:hypothetical protein